MNTFIDIVGLLAIIWTLVSIFGYIVYKYNIVDLKENSWEEAIKTVFSFGLNQIAKEVTGNPHPDKIIDPSLILSGGEVMQILKSLASHPYDTPTLINYSQDSKNILWLEIESMGLVSSYRELSNDGIAKMTQHIIQNYFLETRGFHANLNVKVATPQRLYLAIPLTREAHRFLAKQNKPVQTEFESIKTVEPLIEEIPDIFDDDSKKEDE